MARDTAKIYITAEDKTREAFTSVQRNFSQLQGAASRLSGLLPALGAGLSAAGFAAFVKTSIDAADSLNDMSKATGVAVETLAGFKLAAQQSGVELDTVAKGIQKFSGVVYDAANGSKEAADKIQRLGLDLNALKAQSPEQQFYALAGALQGIAKEQRSAVLIDTLGQKLAYLAPLLEEGAGGLAAMVEEGKRLNPITKEMAEQADKFNDELVKLKAQSSAAGISLAKDLLPSLTDTAAAMRRLADEGKPLQALLRGFAGLGKLPFDLAFGEADFSVGGQVKNLREELQKLEEYQRGSRGRATVGFLSKDEAAQRVAVIKNQIAALEKFKDQIRPPAAAAAEEEAGRRVTPVIDPEKAKSAAKKARDEMQKIFDANRKQEDRNLKVEFDIEAGQIDAEADAFIKARDEIARIKNETIDLIDPTEKYRKKLDEVRKALEAGALTPEQATEAEFYWNEQIDKANEFGKVVEKNNEIGRELGLTFASAFEDAAVNGKSLRDVFKGLAQDIARLAIRKNLTEPMAEFFSQALNFQSQATTTGGSSGGILGGLFSGFFGGGGWGAESWSTAAGSQGTNFLSEQSLMLAAQVSGFADGGIMTGGGPLPLRKYAGGGIATMPQLALFGEGSRNEAFVPLPDGRSIPVKLQGGGGGYIDNRVYNIDARGAQSGVSEEIRRAIKEESDRTVDRSVNKVMDLNQRGALRFS